MQQNRSACVDIAHFSYMLKDLIKLNRYSIPDIPVCPT